MDPRREAGLDEIVSNFDENSSAVVENKYQIYNCEINQCNGSLVVVTEEHIPPENGLNSEIPADLDNCMRLESPQTLSQFALPEDNIVLSFSPNPESCSASANAPNPITFQADVHTPQMPKKDIVVKSVSLTNPKFVKLNFKKQMYFSSEDLNAIEDFEPTAI